MRRRPDSERSVDRGGGRWNAVALGLAGVVVMMLGCGCRVVSRETVETQSILHSLIGGSGGATGTNAVEVLQAKVMRDADRYVAEVAQAVEAFRVRVPTAEARVIGVQWKLMQATGAFIDASGESPILNAIDLMVLASLSRFVVEDQWVGKEFGETARPLLETHIRLEEELWRALEEVLVPAQTQNLKSLLDEYRRKNLDTRMVAIVRFPELVSALRVPHTPESARRSGSILNLLYLNPLAGLDPATQAVEQARLLAQRAFYYAQRAPMLLAWQVELTTYQLAAQPEARQLLDDLDSASGSARSFARTSELLPGLIHTEREEALTQFFDGLARERTNLIAAISAPESAMRGLLPQARETFESGGAMANAVKAAIGSLDGFVRHVTAVDTNAPSGTPSRPFDVREYGDAASRIATAAQDLRALLDTSTHLGPDGERIGQAALRDVKSLLNHAFLLALSLIIAAGVVALGVVAICRRSRALQPLHGSRSTSGNV